VQEFITQYGYIAIFILTFFEGESVLIAAGFLAFSGYLDVYLIIIVSTIASYVGHGAFFLIAFKRREPFINFASRFIKINLKRLESLMLRYGVAAIYISQWIYGFRLMSAAVLGLSRMGKTKYFINLLISCLIWATICTYAGYFFGTALKDILGDIKAYEKHIVVGVLAAGFIIWLIRYVLKKKNSYNNTHTKI
jgi:membrane protein DedA with SNARE-associated domain